MPTNKSANKGTNISRKKDEKNIDKTSGNADLISSSEFSKKGANKSVENDVDLKNYDGNIIFLNEKNELMSKLGYTWKDIFPIVYSTKIKCNGEYYNGLITDFNEGR